VKNIGPKTTNQIHILNTNNEAFIDYKVNKYLRRKSDLEFEEMLEARYKIKCLAYLILGF
jgi:ATP-dependent exoDNAse (exonuclease V) beta subunit